MINSIEMRRLALLIGILGLLANSFECYGAWMISKQARDCCKSGDCSPANHDPCCKAAPSRTVAHHAPPRFHSTAAAAGYVIVPAPRVIARAKAPVVSGSPSGSRVCLPLLI
jgi:hypothetical protein